MKLYYSDVLMPRKACAVARYLDAPVEYIYLNLGKGEHKRPDYLAINPNGKVPTLVDGEQSLWEADAITMALAMRMNSDMWPQERRNQVEVMRWLSWNARHFLPSGGALYFEHVIRPRFNLGPADAAQVETSMAEFRAAAPILDQHLASRAWLVGEAPSIADFSLAVVLPYAEKAALPLAEFPAIRRWHDRLSQFEAWREPFPPR